MDARPSFPVKLHGSSHTIRIDACRLALGGEFAGNVDVDVAGPPGLAEAVLENLSVRLPGTPSDGPAIASAERAGGISVCLTCEAALTHREPPAELELLWADEPVARVAPSLDESVPIEDVARYASSGELAPPQAPYTSQSASRVLLAANRERWWLLATAAAGMLGIVGAPALWAFRVPAPLAVLAAVGVVVLAGTGIGLARRPYRQVWLDRDDGGLRVVRGRWGSLDEKLARAPVLPIADFHHVRLYMRWQITHDLEQEDQEVWLVALEREIRFAGGDGRVHLDPRGLPVGEHRSRAEARRLAADVARLTGLPVLDTGHDGTA